VVHELGSKRRKRLATLQSNLHVKFASYRRNPFKKGNPEGSRELLNKKLKIMNQKKVTKYEDNNIKISKELRDIIHGYIMSDGHVRKEGNLSIAHGETQEAFVKWLYNKLATLRTETPIRISGRPYKDKPGVTYYSYAFDTRSLLLGFHKMWYKPYNSVNKKGKPIIAYKKVLPKSINCFFNSKFLTLWFAGDGTKILGSTGAKFEATAFTADERQTLKVLFKKKFDIDVKINKAGFSKKRNQQWTININASEYQKFRVLITEMSLIEDLFAYKLHKKESTA